MNVLVEKISFNAIQGVHKEYTRMNTRSTQEWSIQGVHKNTCRWACHKKMSEFTDTLKANDVNTFTSKVIVLDDQIVQDEIWNSCLNAGND